jgi:hypothetical protein
MRPLSGVPKERNVTETESLPQRRTKSPGALTVICNDIKEKYDSETKGKFALMFN